MQAPSVTKFGMHLRALDDERVNATLPGVVLLLQERRSGSSIIRGGWRRTVL